MPVDNYGAKGCPDLGLFTGARSHGIDAETWVKEGLVDHLVVHMEVVGKPDASDKVPFIRNYVDMAKGTQTQVHVELKIEDWKRH